MARRHSDIVVAENTPLLPAEVEAQKGHQVACSSWAAYIDIVCVVAGTGVLGLPYTIRQSGWIGLSLVVLSMLITTYTSNLVIKCLYHNGTKRLSSYADIGYDAFGNFGKYGMVGVFTNALLLGVPVLFLIFAAKNLDDMTQYHFGIALGISVWTWICAALVALPFIFVKTLKEVTVLSFFGAFSTFLCVIVVVVLSFGDLHNVRESPTPPSHSLLALAEFPIAFATISFSFGGNIVFPHIEENMRKPGDWNKVTLAAMSTCAVTYVIVAFAGYLVYGDQSLSPILSNLPEGLALSSAMLLITIHVLLTAPILMTSFAIEAEKMLGISTERHSPRNELLLRAAFRSILVVLTALFAIVVPFFGDFMSLLGALANCLLVFVLPVLFHFRLYGWRNLSIWELLWNALIIAVGSIGCIIGTGDAIRALINDFDESSKILG